MIKYQEKIQDFYKMRDTLIAEGYKDFESVKIYDELELREIALEILKSKKVNIKWLLNSNSYEQYNKWYDIPLTEEEYKLLRKVML